ncbi:uncharacterized protein LOC142605897 [Castanea sativa]|uniref:uncharacterized protein LOC142605897 n=1 Tax=Castanea sativa TaxID=21020 RepID=UPI003F653CAA
MENAIVDLLIDADTRSWNSSVIDGLLAPNEVALSENKSGVGVAIWDCRGQMIASLSQVLPQAYDAMEIEAIAAHRALVFGQEVGISEAVLEGDCQAVMQALKNEGRNLASVRPLILDALSQSGTYTKLLYSHTKREGNKLAHSLARHAINVDDYVVWIEDVPPPLISLYQGDLAKLSLRQ